MNKKPTVLLTGTLNNWIKDPTFNILWGNIKNDTKERFKDNLWIHTSDIDKEQLADAKEGAIITTLNSAYLLGKPKEV